MRPLNRVLSVLGIAVREPRRIDDPDYKELMRNVLYKIGIAELQIAEATTLEDLDIGRSSREAALKELQQIVRAAKRNMGIPVKPIAECEQVHRDLLQHLSGRHQQPTRRKHAEAEGG